MGLVSKWTPSVLTQKASYLEKFLTIPRSSSIEVLSHSRFKECFSNFCCVKCKHLLPNFLVDFHALIDANRRCFASCINSTLNHDGLRILLMFNYRGSSRSFIRPNSVVLIVMRLFHCKEFFICEKTSLPVEICVIMQKTS